MALDPTFAKSVFTIGCETCQTPVVILTLLRYDNGRVVKCWHPLPTAVRARLPERYTCQQHDQSATQDRRPIAVGFVHVGAQTTTFVVHLLVHYQVIVYREVVLPNDAIQQATWIAEIQAHLRLSNYRLIASQQWQFRQLWD